MTAVTPRTTAKIIAFVNYRSDEIVQNRNQQRNVKEINSYIIQDVIDCMEYFYSCMIFCLTNTVITKIT